MDRKGEILFQCLHFLYELGTESSDRKEDEVRKFPIRRNNGKK